MNLSTLKLNLLGNKHGFSAPWLGDKWLRYDWLTLVLFAIGMVGYCLLLASVIFTILPPIINILLSISLSVHRIYCLT